MASIDCVDPDCVTILGSVGLANEGEIGVL